MAGVDGVDGGEVGHVLDEQGGLHGAVDVGPRRAENGGQVAEDLFGLGLDPGGDGAAGRVHRDLTGDEDEIADALGLGIGADGGGGLVRVDALHGSLLLIPA